MPLEPGAKLGSFEISSPLGAGGMGEVYRATDPKLRREVAIKILPDDVTQDRDRLSRFEREAQMLASLNHPNIGAIYGFESDGDTRFLILELIEGETLAEKIARDPVPVDEAVNIALQIAEALEAAHDRGIIHRDLKPANVKVTPDGTVKVLDFGLAKAYGAGDGGSGSDEISLSPTLTMAATQAGVILGTAAYMSPEQAAGQMVDRRSDVWAFGVVLMEMLTGRKTFGGETVSHTLASVLKEDPAWENLPGTLPRPVRKLLERCMNKNVRRRLQSIGEARVMLEDYRDAPESFDEQEVTAPAAAEAPPAKTSYLPWMVAGVLAIALAATPFLLGGSPPQVDAQPRRVTMTLGEGEFLFRGYGSSAALSPDGTRVAYIVSGATSRQLRIRYLDQWNATTLVGEGGPSGPYQPFWSPDGQWIGYVTRDELKKVPVRGGSPITLCSVSRNRGATWTHDGTIIFTPDPGSPLFTVSSSGGEPVQLTTLDKEAGEVTHRWPQVLPGGKAVLFTSNTGEGNFENAKIEVLELATGTRKVLHQGASYARYIASGYLIYYYKNTLFGFPFDAERLEVTGSSAPLVEDVSGNKAQGGSQFTVSKDGTLAYATGESEVSTTLSWIDSDRNMKPLWDARQDYLNPSLSPDGNLLAVEIDSEGNPDIWIYDLARQVPTRLTFSDGADMYPVWSPDGEYIYFRSDRGDSESIIRTLADGSGEPEAIIEGKIPLTPTSLSPDGKFLAYTEQDGAVYSVKIYSLESQESTTFVSSGDFNYSGVFSPDGRWIAYGSNESGGFAIYVRPSTGGRGKWQISREGSIWPRWSSSGDAIIVRQIEDGALLRVPVDTTGSSFKAGQVETLIPGPLMVVADADRRYAISPSDDRVVVIQSSGSDDRQHEDLQVVLNWFGEVRQTFDQASGLRP